MFMKFFQKLKQSGLKKRNRIPVEELDIRQCDNCNHEFKGHYCPDCGQEVAEFNRPMGFVLYDFAGNFFSFDTRFFTTFWYMISKPGFLTSEFFAGRRVRYSPPFRIFVFLSFILFLLLQLYSESWLDHKTVLDVKTRDKQSGLAFNFGATIDKDAHQAFPDSVEQLEFFNASLLQDSVINPVRSLVQDSVINSGSNLNIDFSDFKSGNIRENLNIIAVKLEAKLKSETDPEEQKKLNSYIVMCRAPEMVISIILKYLSWTFFFLLPVFALILKLFYIRRNQFYIRHLIFSVHLHSYLFLILVVIISLKLIFLSGIVWIGSILAISFPVYLIVALRKFYGQSLTKTFFKFLGISVIYNTVLWSAVLFVFIKSIGIS